MPNVMLSPPTNQPTTTRQFYGRTYTCAAGQAIPVPDGDANILKANGWYEVPFGTTAQRPKPLSGKVFYDTTLGKMLFAVNGAWVDSGVASGGSSAFGGVTLSGSPPAATVGSAFTWAPAVTGSGTITLSTLGILPAGLTFNAGVLSGTPTNAASYSFFILANNGTGGVAVLPVTISASVGTPVAPTLSALTLSTTSATAGAAYSATISGQTSGSTITATSSDGTALTVSGSTVSGTFSAAGSKTITLTETLTGASNSPRSTTLTITASASNAMPDELLIVLMAA